jgi:thymidylate synthase (FAD)
MKIIPASFEIIAFTPNLEEVIELAGRVCYKSEDKICQGSAPKFVSKIRSMNHESVLEHGSITVKFIVDRGVSHELVRHRVASYSQESTRYCNYTDGKFDGELTFIKPCYWNDKGWMLEEWKKAMEYAEKAYKTIIGEDASTAQEARAVLPCSLKTEIMMTANPREWRHVIRMRAAKAAHPQMQEVMIPLKECFSRRWPSLFGDL